MNHLFQNLNIDKITEKVKEKLRLKLTEKKRAGIEDMNHYRLKTISREEDLSTIPSFSNSKFAFKMMKELSKKNNLTMLHRSPLHSQFKEKEKLVTELPSPNKISWGFLSKIYDETAIMQIKEEIQLENEKEIAFRNLLKNQMDKKREIYAKSKLEELSNDKKLLNKSLEIEEEETKEENELKKIKHDKWKDAMNYNLQQKLNKIKKEEREKQMEEECKNERNKIQEEYEKQEKLLNTKRRKMIMEINRLNKSSKKDYFPEIEISGKNLLESMDENRQKYLNFLSKIQNINIDKLIQRKESQVNSSQDRNNHRSNEPSFSEKYKYVLDMQKKEIEENDKNLNEMNEFEKQINTSIVKEYELNNVIRNQRILGICDPTRIDPCQNFINKYLHLPNLNNLKDKRNKYNNSLNSKFFTNHNIIKKIEKSHDRLDSLKTSINILEKCKKKDRQNLYQQNRLVNRSVNMNNYDFKQLRNCSFREKFNNHSKLHS